MKMINSIVWITASIVWSVIFLITLIDLVSYELIDNLSRIDIIRYHWEDIILAGVYGIGSIFIWNKTFKILN